MTFDQRFRAAPFLFACLLIGACNCEGPGPGNDAGIDDGVVTARFTTAAETVVGEDLILDGTASSGAGISYTWVVTPPADCANAGSFSGDPRAETTTYVAGCVGTHTISLNVENLEGEADEVEQDIEAIFDISGFTLQTVVTTAPFGDEALIDVDVDLSSIPESLEAELAVTATPKAPFTLEPTVRVVGQQAFVEMAEAHGEYEVSVSVQGAGLVGADEVILELVADNTAPEIISFVADGFVTGEPARVRGEASDLDEDEITCSLAFGADNTAEEFPLPTETVEGEETCVFSFDTPQELNAWFIELTTADAFGGEDTATVVVQSGNEAPVVSNVEFDGLANYECDGPQCVSDIVEVSFDVSDDFDAPGDLVYTLSNDEANVNALVVDVDNTTIEGSRVTVRARVERPDVGAMSGNYQFSVLVTESTFALVSNETLLQQAPFVISVQNRPPSVTQIVAPNVNHSFSQGDYTATIELDVSIDDPENTPTTYVMELSVCPNLCELYTVVPVQNGNNVTVRISSDSITDLVGEYNFIATATDADGASGSLNQFVQILNRPPVVSGAFQATRSQRFTSGQGHHAETFLMTDPDGDPLDASGVTVSCPQGACGTINARTDSSAGTKVIVDVAVGIPAFIGKYTMSGTVTDGEDGTSPPPSFTVTNDAPTIQSATTGTQSSHHITAGDLSVSATDDFSINTVSRDLNGDPRTIKIISGNRGSAVFSPVSNVEGTGDATLAAVFNFSTTYDDLVESLTGFNITYVVEDIFGARSPVQTIGIEFLNRSPVGEVTVGVGTSGGTILVFDIPGRFGGRFPASHSRANNGRIGHQQNCGFGMSCLTNASIPVVIDTSGVTDPDGDPIAHRYEVSSSTGLDFSDFGILRDVPANGLLTYLAPVTPHASCDGFSTITDATVVNGNPQRHIDFRFDNGFAVDRLRGARLLGSQSVRVFSNPTLESTCF